MSLDLKITTEGLLIDARSIVKCQDLTLEAFMHPFAHFCFSSVFVSLYRTDANH